MLIIKAKLRIEKKTSAIRKIRKHGECPAIIYSKNTLPSIIIKLNNTDIHHPAHIHHFLKNNKIQLLINNTLTIPTKIQSIQYHPYKLSIIHIDFIRI